MIFHLRSPMILSVNMVCKPLWVLVFLFVGIASFGQTKEELQKKRDELNRKIELTRKLINETKANQQNTAAKLQILKEQIRLREELVQNINREVRNINKDITDTEAEITLLHERIEALKEEYARMVLYAYKNEKSHDALMYIFASENFNQAFKRFKMLQEYSDVRKRQAQEIRNNQAELQLKVDQLKEIREEKELLAESQAAEKQELATDKQKRQQTLQSLQAQEADLRKQQTQHEKERQKLNAAIERIIAEELAAEKNKNNGVYELTPAGKIVSANFEKNKGQLPWPVARGVITGRFGQHAHPTIPGITVDNKGVDIATEQNASVMAIFGGEVTSVFSIPGAGQNVIVTHGAYKTVYTSLKEVLVRKGDTVDARQKIGTVLSQNDKTIAHLEIWKVSSSGGVPQDPGKWILNQ